VTARYRSHVEFRPKPGREAEFVAAFHACGMLTRPQEIPGFVVAHLYRDDAAYVVIGEWETRESYAAWRAVAQRGAPADALRALGASIDAVTPGRLLEAVDPPVSG